MHDKPYLAEERPECRLIIDEKPPIGTRIYLISQYGAGCIGTWSAYMTDVVAWAYLPKMSPEQKRKLMAHQAASCVTNCVMPQNP